MIARILLLLTLCMSTSAWSQASQSCPWLNAGTAAKVLDGPVTVTAHSSSPWRGSCRFVRSGIPAASIAVTVDGADRHPCGTAGTRLSAIGNKALFCSSKQPDRSDAQTITGRVRDAWFVVVLVRPPATRHVPSMQLGKDKTDSSTIEFLAEQISGNLY